MISYDTTVGAAQTQQIESYLALKYGITLDQTTATNYVASDSSLLWDSSADADYNENIVGIARDDDSGLDQRISQSVNSGAILTIATNNTTKDFTSPNTGTGRIQLNNLHTISVASNS